LNRAATLGVAAAAMAIMSLAALSIGPMAGSLDPSPDLAKQALSSEGHRAIDSMREVECFFAF
jgi:hypothetical protein